MACSQCGSSLYSCHLEAGPGIAISGDGTTSNPYTITNTGDATGSVTCEQVDACLVGSGYVQVVGTLADGDIAVYDSASQTWVPSQNYLHNVVGGSDTNEVTATDNVTPELVLVPGASQTADAFQVTPAGAAGPGFRVTAKGYGRAAALTATDVPFAVTGANAQTADLQQWITNTGSVVGKAGPDGVFAAPNIGPAPVIASATAPTTNPTGGPLITGTVWVDTSGAAA